MVKTLLLLLLSPIVVWGACNTSTLVTTPDSASVTTCIASATAGQTITLSTGSATYSSTVSIPKSLTIAVAAGATVTLTQNATGLPFFSISTGSASSFVRISGDNGSSSNCGVTGVGCGLVLQAVSPAIDNADILDILGPIGNASALTTTGVRLDHIKWSGGDAGVCSNCGGSATGPVYGVVDHSYFLNMGRAYFAQDRRNADTAAGSVAWADFLANESTYPGNAFDFVTFEDDLFDWNTNPPFNDSSLAQGSLYGQYGGKVVFRHDVIRNWGLGIDAHGDLDASGYGTIMYDIYSNNISTNSTFGGFCEGKEMYLRGGRYLVHDNNFGGGCQDTPIAVIIYNGASDPDNHRIHDTFIWNNQQCDTNMANCIAQNNATILSNESSSCSPGPCLQVNVNYFFRQPTTGDFGGLAGAYTAFTYPHPLIGTPALSAPRTSGRLLADIKEILNGNFHIDLRTWL